MLALHDPRRACLALRFFRACLVRGGHASESTPVVIYESNGINALLRHVDLSDGLKTIKETQPFPSADYYDSVEPKLVELLGTADVILVRHFEPNSLHRGWRRINAQLLRWHSLPDTGNVQQRLYKVV
jgi:hypothetical protein